MNKILQQYIALETIVAELNNDGLIQLAEDLLDAMDGFRDYLPPETVKLIDEEN
jgi:hypothetical protein